MGEGGTRAGGEARDQRVRSARSRLPVLLLPAALLLGGPVRADSGFSSERAFGHLEALSEIGPRVAGSEGAARARAYIREQLEAIGAEVSDLEIEASPFSGQTLTLTHVLGELPGESSDRVLLAAPYDTTPAESFRYVGANASASGAAVVLELGRVLSEGPRPYTVQLLFIDGDALGRREGGGTARRLGSRGIAELWKDEGLLPRIRVAFFFGQVADPDLIIARDLRSSRIYRNRMWTVAAELGHTDAFPSEAGFESPAGSHIAFADRGLRSFVAVTDDRYGGDERPGIFDFTEKDTPEQCSAESLGVVGEVAAATLDRIEAQLVRIDRFVRSPRPGEDVPVGDLDDTSDEDEPPAEEESPETPPLDL